MPRMNAPGCPQSKVKVRPALPALRIVTWARLEQRLHAVRGHSCWHGDCPVRHVGTGEYQRRKPEDTVLYEVVRDHVMEMFQRAEERSPNGEGLPRYVKQAFTGYLDCGVLAKGFLRIRYPDCAYDTVVGFS